MRRTRRGDVVGLVGQQCGGEDQVIFAVGDYHVVVSVCVSVYGGPRRGGRWCGLIGGNSMLCSGRCPQRGHASISIPVRASIHWAAVLGVLSSGWGGGIPSPWRHWASIEVLHRLARKPKWRILMSPVGSTCKSQLPDAPSSGPGLDSKAILEKARQFASLKRYARSTRRNYLAWISR